MSATPLISCLCVTEGRGPFMPWLLWGFRRQSWPCKELVVVDSSPRPFEPDDPTVRVIRAPVGSNVPTKRNLALDAARGQFLAWFDDDDWQHPERLELLARRLENRPAFVGPSQSWFVDLFTDRCRRYDGQAAIIFNSALFDAERARGVRFDESRQRASDTLWLRELGRRFPGAGERVPDAVLTLWLCHDSNISNPRQRRAFPLDLEQLRHGLGPAAWADTDARLEALRRELPAAPDVALRRHRTPPSDIGPALAPRRERAPLGGERRVVIQRALERRRLRPPATSPTVEPGPTPAPPPVAALLVLGQRSAEAVACLSVRHLLRQAKCTFSRKLLVHGQAPAALLATTNVDRVISEAAWPEIVAALLEDGPEYTLVAYPGELFFSGGDSWVRKACAELARSGCDALCSQPGPLERSTRIVGHGAAQRLGVPGPLELAQRSFVVKTRTLLEQLRAGDGTRLADGAPAAWRVATLRQRSNWSTRTASTDTAALELLIQLFEAGQYPRSLRVELPPTRPSYSQLADHENA